MLQSGRFVKWQGDMVRFRFLLGNLVSEMASFGFILMILKRCLIYLVRFLFSVEGLLYFIDLPIVHTALGQVRTDATQGPRGVR